MKRQINGILLLGAVVAAACGIGIMMVGTPIAQKYINFDTTRINDFNTIKNSVESYYQTNHMLPKSLDDIVKKDTFSSKTPTDPETKKPYDYTSITLTSYKLCTTFSTNSNEVQKQYGNNGNGYNLYGTYGTDSNHKKGYDCIAYDLPSYLGTAPTPMVYENVPTPSVDRTNDNKRIKDMWEIQGAFNKYYTQNKKLPLSLDEIKTLSPSVSITDPVTGTEYSYAPFDADRNYSICAYYDNISNVISSYAGAPEGHAKGYYCSKFTTPGSAGSTPSPIPTFK